MSDWMKLEGGEKLSRFRDEKGNAGQGTRLGGGAGS